MLSLTRRIDESVVIYEGDRKIAEIFIRGVRGRQVRLGLEAKPEITFVRSEVDSNQAEEGEQKCEDL